MRYLSPPLFPVHLREMQRLVLHECRRRVRRRGVPRGDQPRLSSGPTVACRITTPDGTLAFFPDHEVALGVPRFPATPEWTSGWTIARGADLLIHDAQYTAAEYPEHVGWGHSAIDHTLAFATLAGVKHLVTFHHGPLAHRRGRRPHDGRGDRARAPRSASAPAPRGPCSSCPRMTARRPGGTRNAT